ncbi:hypothetical protein Tco_0804875 [Tanacetum coccineum]
MWSKILEVKGDLEAGGREKDPGFTCMYSRETKQLTIKNRLPLPELMTCLTNYNVACCFSKIDLRSGYHQLRVREEKEDIIEDRVRNRLTDTLSSQSCLWVTNAMASKYLHGPYMTAVCKPYLDKFVIMFIEDILIYSNSEGEHEVHLKTILDLLKKEKLYANFQSGNLVKRVQFSGGHVVIRDDWTRDFVVYCDASKQGFGGADAAGQSDSICVKIVDEA